MAKTANPYSKSSIFANSQESQAQNTPLDDIVVLPGKLTPLMMTVDALLANEALSLANEHKNNRRLKK